MGPSPSPAPSACAAQARAMLPGGTSRLRGGRQPTPSLLGWIFLPSPRYKCCESSRAPCPGREDFPLWDLRTLTPSPWVQGSFTWHVTAELLLFREGWTIFLTDSSPALISLSSLPPPPTLSDYSPPHSLPKTRRALHPTGPADAQCFFPTHQLPEHLCLPSPWSPALRHHLRAPHEHPWPP